MKRIIVVGVTGSIGRQTLDVISKHSDRFTLVGASAHTDEAGLLKALTPYPEARACLSGAGQHIGISNGPGAGSLKPVSGSITYAGPQGLRRMIEDTEADIVLNAAAGADGLGPSFAALASGKDLALANKETIVMAGRLALELARKNGKKILPVDSEHSAIFNMVERFGTRNLREVIITASGGAFRDTPLERLASMTPKDALAHPTWNMGAKITIDSATMANKGLEVIEAARLFSLEPARIDVVIHPESRVHSFIRTLDGSLYAQLSRPDMRLPILNALSWPETIEESVADMTPGDVQLRFYPPEPERYPMLALAYEALASGEGATDAYNAANEVAVDAFISGRVPFTAIHTIVAACLEHEFAARLENIDEVLAIDAKARSITRRILEETR